jgi:hypothetical protein
MQNAFTNQESTVMEVFVPNCWAPSGTEPDRGRALMITLCWWPCQCGVKKKCRGVLSLQCGSIVDHTTLPAQQSGPAGTVKFLVWPKGTTRQVYKFESGCPQLYAIQKTLIFAMTPVDSDTKRVDTGTISTQRTCYKRADFALKVGATSTYPIISTPHTSPPFPTPSSPAYPPMVTISGLPPPALTPSLPPSPPQP